MGFIKYILELILVTIIIFFVWNILKRIFFQKFYQNFPNLNPQNQTKTKQLKQKVNWDAETVDYEEINEDQKKG